MNERIRELAEQAREYASDYVADCKHYGYYMEHNELEIKFEEKFAELIIKEALGDLKERIALRYQGSQKDHYIAYGMEIVYFDIVNKFEVI